MSDYFVHPTAIVDEGAQLGKGTKVWHFSHVSPGAVIGENCSFGQNVFVANRVTIGNGCKVQNNVSLYEGVVLEDFVFCGPSMVFTNVRTPRRLVNTVGRPGSANCPSTTNTQSQRLRSTSARNTLASEEPAISSSPS